jgi:hypothetical protein
MIEVVQGATKDEAAAREAMRSWWTRALITVTWMWVVVPRLLQTLTAPKYRGSVGVDSVPYSALAALSLTLLTLGVVGLCLIVIIDRLRDPQALSLGPLLLMVLPWVYLVVRDLQDGDMPTITALAYVLVIAALWLLRPRVEELGWLGVLVGVAAVLSVGLALALPAKGIFFTSAGAIVEADKATLPIGIVVGFFTHGNTLGQFLALGLPFVAMVRRRGLRIVLLAFTVFALVGSASRAAILASVMAAVVAAALGPMGPRLRRGLGPVMALVPLCAVVAVPLLTADPRAFSNRGFIWSVSLEWWHGSPLFGLASDYYAEVGRTSERVASTVFNGHNLFVHLAVTGGVVLLALVAVQFVTLAVRAGRVAANGHRIGVVYLVALAGASLMEKSVGFVDATSVFPVVVVPLGIIMFTRLSPPEAEREVTAEATRAAGGTRR